MGKAGRRRHPSQHEALFSLAESVSRSTFLLFRNKVSLTIPCSQFLLFSVIPVLILDQYPSSSHYTRNWDKLVGDIKEEEKNENLEGDAALNKLFQQIYSDGSDEVKKAMNKSFVSPGLEYKHPFIVLQ